ncbi:MAG: hypothetical protein N2442_05525 [Spirochaetes bacterium]|nr:hypothetical protein [Spirochaetota bacterium]
MMGGIVRFFILYTLLCFFPSYLLVAGGVKEDPIALARSLIIEKRYNEALVVLAEAARKDPERIEEAENLIRRIRAIRGEYYDKYEDLIKVLYEQKDVEKALSIIRELESLDAAPNETTRVALKKAKESAQFVYNQNRFNDLMAQAAMALERKDYGSAVELYVGGFDIGREFFTDAKYGNIVETRVYSILDTVRRTSEQFLRFRNQYISLANSLQDRIRQGKDEEVRAALGAFLETFSRASVLFKVAAESVEELKDQNEKLIQIRRVTNEDIFLGFLHRIIGGRSTSKTPEGIRGAAMQLLWDRFFPILVTLSDRIRTVYLEGETFYDQAQWEQASLAFQRVQTLKQIADRLERIYFEALPLVGSRPVSVYWDLVEDYFPLWIDQMVRTKGINQYQRLVGEYLALKSDLDSMPNDRAALEILRSSLRTSKERTQEDRREWELFQKEIRGNPFIPQESWVALDRIAIKLSDRLTFWERNEVEIVDRLAMLDLFPLEDKHREILAAYRKATEWFEGVEEVVQIAEGQEEKLLVKYPDRTIALLQNLSPTAEALLEAVGRYLSQYRNEIPPARSDPRIRQKIDRADSIRSSLQGTILPGAVTLGTKARENILLAERYRNEGNRRVQEAQAAIAQNRFEQARENLGAARQRFSLSLSYQEDPRFRRESDALLLSLNAAIQDAENKLVVAEVRQLINEAKRLYYLNAFDDSENILLRAQTRWRATQPEDNPEITYWLGFVRAALFVKSSRELLPTDPLYVEMSQLLSLARKDFETGRSLLERGNRREALDAFTAAEEKIRTVLLAFPFNQQASVLSLRIAQLKDRDGFATLFRTKFREAQAKMASNPQEAYIDLKDLEQIDPNFTGLKEAIYNAEIRLGIRIPPPDPKALAESEELYRAALRIVTGNVRAQFPIALEQLNRAIELNPENTKAIELKDRIQIDTGGQTSIVLSSVAEEQYRLAEKRYIEGNYFEALAIVQRLLQNKESKNYPPLLELKRRIESRI